MSNLTESRPHWYGILDNGNIHLYLLVKVPVGKTITFPVSGRTSGQTITFQILIEDTKPGQNDQAGLHFHNYTFAEGSLDSIKVKTSVNGMDHKTVAIVISDLDLTPATDLPTLESGTNAALGVPYACTKWVSEEVFLAQVYVRTAEKNIFSAAHHLPADNDTDKNTSSVITAVPNVNGENAFYTEFQFDVDADLSISEGAHEASFNGGKKTKTKNKNHTVNPFPPIRKQD